jgi:hypothetical protein
MENPFKKNTRRLVLEQETVKRPALTVKSGIRAGDDLGTVDLRGSNTNNRKGGRYL